MGSNTGQSEADRPFIGPCACDEDAGPGEAPAVSCGLKQYLSPEEEAICRQMRTVHRDAQRVKRDLRLLPDSAANAGRHEALRTELEQLRARFEQLRGELREANRIKMIRLGHRV